MEIIDELKGKEWQSKTNSKVAKSKVKIHDQRKFGKMMSAGLNAMIDDAKKMREGLATKDKDGNTKRVKPLSTRQVADLLEKYFTFARIVDNINNRKERDKAPVYLFDADEQIYIIDNESIAKFINDAEKTINKAGAKMILYWLKTEAPFLQRTQSTNYVAVGNGIYSLKDKALLNEFIPDKFVFTSKIATNYVDDPEEPTFKDWKFSEWIKNDVCDNNQEKELLFWQAVYCIVNPNDNKKGVLLLTDDGKGNTGKGTLQQLFTNLVGEENTAPLKLAQFQNDFTLASAVNANLIIGDDNNPRDYIKDTSNLKSIIAKDTILCNPKGEEPFAATITAFILQSMNGMPKFKDTTQANFDRFRALNFNKRYNDNEVNPNIKERYIKDHRLLEWILNKALHVAPFKRLVKTEESTLIVENARKDSDPILEFVNDHIDEFTSERIPNEALFNIFRTVYQHENGKKTEISSRSFLARAKPYMKNKGWVYGKDIRASDCWNESDKEHFMKMYDVNYLRGTGIGYSYPFVISSEQKGCFYRKK